MAPIIYRPRPVPSQPTQPALMVRANFGELTLGEYAAFQRDLRDVIVAFVGFEVISESGSNWSNRQIKDMVQVSASIAANPLLEIFDTAETVAVSTGVVVSTAIINAGRFMDTCARIGTFGLERRARKTGHDKQIAENQRDTIKARFETEQVIRDNELRVHAEAAQQAIAKFEEYKVDARDFGVRLISRAEVARIRSEIIDLANEAAWISPQAEFTFDDITGSDEMPF